MWTSCHLPYSMLEFYKADAADRNQLVFNITDEPIKEYVSFMSDTYFSQGTLFISMIKQSDRRREQRGILWIAQ